MTGSETMELQIFHSGKTFFPWTKLYNLMAVPEIYGNAVEDHTAFDMALVREMTENNPNRAVILVMNDERALGFILMTRVRAFQREFHVGFRREVPGLAKKQIIQIALMSCFEDGYKKITAEVPAFNRAASHLAISAGFAREGVVKGAFCREGKMVDIIIYGMRL